MVWRFNFPDHSAYHNVIPNEANYHWRGYRRYCATLNPAVSAASDCFHTRFDRAVLSSLILLLP